MQPRTKMLTLTVLLTCLLPACGTEPTQVEPQVDASTKSPSAVTAPARHKEGDIPEPVNDPDIDDALSAFSESSDKDQQHPPLAVDQPASAADDDIRKHTRLAGNAPVNMFETAPPHLHQAIRDARAQIDVFWTGLETREPGNQSFFITAGFRDTAGGLEIIRLTPVMRNDNMMTGTANTASKALAEKINIGDTVLFSVEDVYNWRFVKGMRIVGGFIKKAEENQPKGLNKAQ